MADRSAIEWTAATWNPTTGCDRVSPGCDHCYAMSLAGRLKAMGQPKYQRDGDARTSGPGFGVAMHPGALEVPLRWRRPRRVFVDSMSDLFHARVSVAFVTRVWSVMAQTPQHSYQVLTKRPERLERVLAAVRDELRPAAWPLPNVWLGTSIESDRYTGRADHLRAAPAAVRFLSLEPLLGPLTSLRLTGIDWVIAGGESGRGERGPASSGGAAALGLAAEITSRARWARDHGDGRPRPAWSTGERLYVALVLGDQETLDAEGCTRREAEQRLAGDLAFLGYSGGVSAWLDGIKAALGRPR